MLPAYPRSLEDVMSDHELVETKFEQDIRKELADIKQSTEELKRIEEAHIG